MDSSAPVTGVKYWNDAPNAMLEVGVVTDDWCTEEMLHSHQYRPTVHDCERWVKRFKQLAKVEPNLLKKLRLVIQMGAYPHPRGTGAVVINTEECHRKFRQGTVLYHEAPADLGADGHHKVAEKTRLVVLHGDCVEGAQWMERNGCTRVCLLNMANRNTPGGGYRGGSGAQEENLMRRSNYFESIEDRGEKVHGKGVAAAKYPLPLFGCIVSHDVLFFRGSEAAGYPFLAQPNVFGVVASAAIARPFVMPNGRLGAEDEATTLQKMRTILFAAWKEGYDGIVLSAFGCGAFRNPPAHIAALFKQACTEFDGFFHTIAFSIIEDHNSARNEEGNLKPFEREFGTATRI